MARNFEFRENNEFIQAQVQEAQLATRAALLKHIEPVDDNAHVDDDNADDDTHSIISDISYGGYEQMTAGFTTVLLNLQEKFNTQIKTLIEKNNALQKSIESLEQKNEDQTLLIHQLKDRACILEEKASSLTKIEAKLVDLESNSKQNSNHCAVNQKAIENLQTISNETQSVCLSRHDTVKTIFNKHTHQSGNKSWNFVVTPKNSRGNSDNPPPGTSYITNTAEPNSIIS